jgi:hypothetical protein
MTNDSSRISPSLRVECRLDDDPRLMVGITEIIAHVAEHALLSEQERDNFKAAVLDAFREGFLLEHRKSAPATIHFVAADFPDRVEVAIGSSVPVVAEEIPKAMKGSVEREVRDGRLYVTLAKSKGSASSSGGSKSGQTI